MENLRAQELRIGNYVNYEQTTHVIHQLTNSICGSYWHKSNASDSYAHTYDEIKPIPLTEEWLERFGFERLGNGFEFWESSVFNIEFIRNHWHISYTSNVLCTHIKYVHQLQNLYFALTGEELTIKTLK
jgi:hypothetical protein